MASLPSDLISDILIRLSVKPLLRFRCLSKPICSQIDGPDFIKLHLNHSTLTNSHRRIILSSAVCCKLYVLDLDYLDEAQDMIHNPLSTLELTNEAVQVIGSCNGLLCLRKPRNHIVLWNPCTRKHLKVPFHFPQFSSPNYNVVYGFGHDSLRDDYKLLIIAQVDYTYDSRAFVYSMKSNLWRSVTGFPFCFSNWKFNGVFVSGAVHFIVTETEGSNGFIMAVDVAGEGDEFGYREVPAPPDFSKSAITDMGVLNECLCVTCCLDGCSVVVVWVMKDYGVMESWTKLFSFSRDEVGRFYNKPVATLSGGNEVVMHEDDCDDLLVYDLEENEWETMKVVGGSQSFVADVYMESLVNPVSTATATRGGGKGTRKRTASGIFK